jgi:Asp/Glu/hydantoin racemase
MHTLDTSPGPPELLLINPNTSASVTALLLQAAQQRAARLGRQGGAVAVRAATAPFGPRYITGELGAAVAAHAALEAYAADVAQHGPPSAVLLACFGDPGLFALRALSSVPVLGLAEAAMRAAAACGPFVVLTGGAAWVPMLERLAQALALPAPMLGVQALPRSGGEMAAQPEQAVGWLAEAGAAALRRWPDARSLLLGGAGLAGLAAPLAGRLPVPVLDNVELALDEALRVAAATPPPAAAQRLGGAGVHEPGPWHGLGAGLSALLPAEAAPAPIPWTGPPP